MQYNTSNHIVPKNKAWPYTPCFVRVNKRKKAKKRGASRKMQGLSRAALTVFFREPNTLVPHKARRSLQTAEAPFLIPCKENVYASCNTSLKYFVNSGTISNKSPTMP